MKKGYFVLMGSPAYDLFARAIRERKQIACIYDGYPRELCPFVLGHSADEEKALTFQFGGRGKSLLPPRGDWRCLFLSRVKNIVLRDGPWRGGDSHKQAQRCVETVDLDVNPASPYNPKRR